WLLVFGILGPVIPFCLGRPLGLGIHVILAVGDEAPSVARLYGTEPERCVGRLRWQYIRDVRALNVLVMQSRGIEHGVLAGCIWSIDVHRQARAISHGDTDVPLFHHQVVSARSAAGTADVLR